MVDLKISNEILQTGECCLRKPSQTNVQEATVGKRVFGSYLAKKLLDGKVVSFKKG